MATLRANGQCERMNRTVLNSLATTSAGAPEDEWDGFVKKVQSGINSETNRTTGSSPAQILNGFKPWSTADAVLLGAIQTTFDRVDLEALRKKTKRSTDVEQAQQKARRRGHGVFESTSNGSQQEANGEVEGFF